MHLSSFNSASLYRVLGSIIVVTVLSVLGTYEAINYKISRDEMTRELHEQVDLSIATLQQNLAGYIESYAIGEYESLVETEIILRGHYAILVKDRNMGNLLGKETYIIGKIHNSLNELVDYDASNSAHERWLKKAYFSVTSPILNNAGKDLGSVSIYTSDNKIRHQLNHLLIETVTETSVVLVLLIGFILFTIRQLLVRPMRQIVKALEMRDGDGIPVNTIPRFGFHETGILADTINTMLTVIKESRKSLAKERNRLSNVINGTQVGTWEWNIDSGRVTINERWAEILGYSHSELHHISIDQWKKMIHADDLSVVESMLEKHFSGESSHYSCEVRMNRKDGEWVWVLGRGGITIRSKQGEPLVMSGTILDITRRKQDEEKLRQSASVFEHANEGIIITDHTGAILDVNEAFITITGYSRDDVLGKNPRILKSGKYDKSFYDGMWRCLIEEGRWTGELWNRRKDGSLYANKTTISSLKTSDQELRFVALFSDITDIKEYQKRLEHIAHFDPLTGLPNRELLSDRLRQAMSNAQRHHTLLGVVYLDLDGFKQINDTHGHDTGDKLLRVISTRLKDVLRESDTLGRIGGDEFVAVLSDLHTLEECVPILERFRTAASMPVNIDNVELRVSVSIGVTFYRPNESVDGDQLIRQSDQAMYQAKQSGKDRYHIFDSEQDRAVRWHFEELENIQNALANREFILHYQPKVDMQTGRLHGVEALIRWQHPERGLLPPGDFLPILTNNPLMIDVGDWVLEAAASQVELWRSEGLEIPVSVNVDGSQIAQTDFIEKLQACLDRHPTLKAGDLELEIVETSALVDIDRINALINASVAMGIDFALDDFGTGYSSLTYLKRLPAKTLKIDKSFVRDMLEDPEDLAILEGIIGLSEAFQREVVAEGVETVTHGNLLIALGCHIGQGYGIARPMPAKDVVTWLSVWQPEKEWVHGNKIGYENLPVLFSMSEHRAWVSKLKDYVIGEEAVPPELDVHQCRFSRWLYHEGVQRHAGNAELTKIMVLHERIHAQAKVIISLKSFGEKDAMNASLVEIKDLRDELLSRMELLIK